MSKNLIIIIIVIIIIVGLVGLFIRPVKECRIRTDIPSPLETMDCKCIGKGGWVPGDHFSDNSFNCKGITLEVTFASQLFEGIYHKIFI